MWSNYSWKRPIRVDAGDLSQLFHSGSSKALRSTFPASILKNNFYNKIKRILSLHGDGSRGTFR